MSSHDAILPDTASGIAATHARVAVNLGERSYDITVGEGLLDGAGSLLRAMLPRPFTVVITDDNVARHCLPALAASLDAANITHRSLVVPAGEQSKSFDQLEYLCNALISAGVDRSDRVIALGGGVVGDLAGFAAAIVRRGIGFIQIPTTLLAQVDSSVGGKTGINSVHGKNLVGAFHQPQAVLADIGALNSLPRRQLLAGYAEVAKYGLLGDSEFFDWLEHNGRRVVDGDIQARVHAVTTSCRAKARIVAEDEREHATRALLNLGHTFAHALEAATGYGDVLLHGEAVAIGMAMAFRFSRHLGRCEPGTAERVAQHLHMVGLPVHASDIETRLPPARDLVEIMRQDKKATAGHINFILARDIGDAYVDRTVDEGQLLKFLEGELETR